MQKWTFLNLNYDLPHIRRFCRGLQMTKAVHNIVELLSSATFGLLSETLEMFDDRSHNHACTTEKNEMMQQLWGSWQLSTYNRLLRPRATEFKIFLTKMNLQIIRLENYALNPFIGLLISHILTCVPEIKRWSFVHQSDWVWNFRNVELKMK